VDWQKPISDQISQNGRLFFNLAYGILGKMGEAEDVCQTAILLAWQERAQLRDSASLKAWLARIVLNESLRVQRRRTVENRYMEAASRERQLSDASRDQIEIEDSVSAALEQLTEQQRIVVALRIMQGISGKEVAKILGISDTTVSRLLHAAIQRLREIMQDWRETTGETA